MRFHVLATDYDGTLALHGAVDEATIDALTRLRASRRKLVLVTGRQLEDLMRVFSRLDLFDAVVAENGAVVYQLPSRQIRSLAEPPPPAFVEALRRRGVANVDVGRVIVATWEPHEKAALETIHEMGLELQVIFNKGAVMVLPSGINKAVGLRAALDDLGLSPHNTVGIGDAENDHALLAACECAVAVANALPSLKDRADLVTTHDHGAGVVELVESLLASDLAEVAPRLGRHDLPLGTAPDGALARLPAYGPPVLLVGPSASGKSTIVRALMERLTEHGYQFCVIDPEGDYVETEGAMVLGDAARPPAVSEVLEVLSDPADNVAVNLLGVALADRPTYSEELFFRLRELRGRTGRPHWIIVDEAHHLFPARTTRPREPLPGGLPGLLLVTVHPGHLAAELLSEVDRAVVVGTSPAQTLAELAMALGEAPPALPGVPLVPGEAILYRRSTDAPLRLRVSVPKTERRRHVRKYAAGELGPDKSFYFRGPAGRLKLRVQNLQLFVQLAEGLDDETWLFHLRRGDYSGWFRDAIKDSDLAAEAAAVEGDGSLSPGLSRARIRTAIERRYTAPA